MIFIFSRKNKLIKNKSDYRYFKFVESNTNFKLTKFPYKVNKIDNPMILRGLILVLSIIIVFISGYFINTLITNYKNGNLGFNSNENLSTDSLDDNNSVDASNIKENRLLTIINSKRPVSDKFVLPKLVVYNGVLVSEDIVESLEKMLKDAKCDGIDLVLKEGYISKEAAQKIYDDTIKYYRDELGYSIVKSEALTMREFPKGEHNERQTGLIVSFSGDIDDFSKTEEYGWIMKNCVKYGFVLRYADNKKNITGVSGKSDLFRYVGEENAKRMRSLDMCLEEFVSYLSKQNAGP